MRAIALVAIFAASPALSEDVGPWMDYWTSADFGGAGWELKNSTSVAISEQVIVFTFWEQFIPAVVGETLTTTDGYTIREIGEESRHTARCATRFSHDLSVISDACEMLQLSEE